MKMVTRTVTNYVYTFGRMEREGDIIKITDKVEYRTMDKLGPKNRKKVMAENGWNDLEFVDVHEESQLYGMTVEDFMQFAAPITRGPSDTNYTKQ